MLKIVYVVHTGRRDANAGAAEDPVVYAGGREHHVGGLHGVAPQARGVSRAITMEDSPCCGAAAAVPLRQRMHL